MTSYVVKIGGNALDSLAPDAPVLVALASDIAALREQGIDVALVHGGGPQIAALLHDVGRESRFDEGLRVTDVTTMTYVAMALSLVNVSLVAALNHAGLAAVGVSGADDSLFRAEALGERWGRAAGAPKCDKDLIEKLWSCGITPVVSSVATDASGELVNCNADAAAGSLAGALDAEALILLSDVDQLRRDPDDPSSVLERVEGSTILHMIADGSIRDGMRPKMSAALDALSGGAAKVLLANGSKEHALSGVLNGSTTTTEVVA